MKALLAFPWVSRRAAPTALHDYLRSGVVDGNSETLFADISQIPAAHFMEIPLDAPAAAPAQAYWRLPEDPRGTMGEAEAVRRLREIFFESVELHMRSDVPIGAALSGGIDSSAIVMAMRSLAGDKAEIHTFTYAADDSTINEERWAEQIGLAAGVHMHRTRATPDDLATDLDSLILAQDQPFGSTSIYVQNRVFRLAQEVGIKVMLDGQGADEMFAGYRPFIAARMASMLRAGSIGEAWRLLREMSALPGERLPRNLLRIAAGLAPGNLVDAMLRLRARQRRVSPWLDTAWFASRGVAESGTRFRGRFGLSEALTLSFSETSLPALLRYEDRNSMAHSVESRVPFLTPALVEFAFRLPEPFLVGPDAISKGIFRRAMRGIIPDAILDRRDKIGFQTPEREWLRALRPWVETTLRSATAQSIPALRSEAMAAEFDAVMAGKLPFDWRIWRWLNLIRWAELFAVRFD
jgi:asparagine synthase (glutamine-hydrolysing)